MAPSNCSSRSGVNVHLESGRCVVSNPQATHRKRRTQIESRATHGLTPVAARGSALISRPRLLCFTCIFPPSRSARPPPGSHRSACRHLIGPSGWQSPVLSGPSRVTGQPVGPVTCSVRQPHHAIRIIVLAVAPCFATQRAIHFHWIMPTLSRVHCGRRSGSPSIHDARANRHRAHRRAVHADFPLVHDWVRLCRFRLGGTAVSLPGAPAATCEFAAGACGGGSIGGSSARGGVGKCAGGGDGCPLACRGDTGGREGRSRARGGRPVSRGGSSGGRSSEA